MNKKQMILLIVLICLAIVFSFIVIKGLYEGDKCLSNPLVYGANKLEQSEETKGVYCSCFVSNPKLNINFAFTKDGIINNDLSN